MRRRVLETSTDYTKPWRPLPVRLFNKAGGFLRWPRDLSIPDLLKAAERKTGLREWGNDWFIEPLSVLLGSLEEEARLTPFGRLIQKYRLVDALSNRLRVEEYLRKAPETASVNPGKLILIAGLQRTGTTTLHRLLAANPEVRSLSSWEALNPVPLPGDRDNQKRIKIARTAQKTLAYIAPEFFAVHPVEYNAPEEDVLLLDLCFMSQAPEATFHVPSYASWLEEQDHTRAYEYLKLLLQILSSQEPKPVWVLKTPHHMEHLDVILKIFPEATIVQTHRDPCKTTGSFCSMVAHGRGIFSDHVDPVEVGRHWTRKVRRMMERSMQVREKLGDDPFVDISYYDLLRDPIEVVRNVYEHAGIPFSEEAKIATEKARTKNVQHRYGRHVYRLESFGLSEAQIQDEYDFYRRRYQIPREEVSRSRH